MLTYSAQKKGPFDTHIHTMPYILEVNPPSPPPRGFQFCDCVHCSYLGPFLLESICPDTVAIAFFLSTETHAKRLLTIWKRSVWTTLKRSFAVLANQIIVSETFQAFRILASQISVRKTLSWKPCLVANVSSCASLVNQNPADSSYLRSFFFFFFFFFFSFT